MIQNVDEIGLAIFFLYNNLFSQTIINKFIKMDQRIKIKIAKTDKIPKAKLNINKTG